MTLPWAEQVALDEYLSRRNAEEAAASARAAEVLGRAIAGDEPVGGILAGQPRYSTLASALAGSRRQPSGAVAPTTPEVTEADRIARQFFGLDTTESH